MVCVCRARHHLHIVFATSPVGAAFSTRCRQFPSLVNCMTIDWFSPWPSEALLGVGIRILEGLSLVPGPAAAQIPVPPASGVQDGAKAATAASTNGGSSICGGVLQGLAAGPAGAAAGSGATDGIVVRVARVCVEVHKAVEAEAERLHQQQQRR